VAHAAIPVVSVNACGRRVDSLYFRKHWSIDPELQEDRFNYIVNIFTKWYRNYLHFYAKYRCPGPNAVEPFFETTFARMEYVGRDRWSVPEVSRLREGWWHDHKTSRTGLKQHGYRHGCRNRYIRTPRCETLPNKSTRWTYLPPYWTAARKKAKGEGFQTLCTATAAFWRTSTRQSPRMWWSW